MTVKNKVKVKTKDELSKKQASALAKVLGKVEIESKAIVAEDEVEATKVEENVLPDEKEVEVEATSDLLAIVTKYAEATSDLAKAESKITKLTSEKAISEVNFSNLKADAEIIHKAASHACNIYGSQLGKPLIDYENMSKTSLSKSFSDLRDEFNETFPEGRNSQNSEDSTNSPSKTNSNIHPISTARSSR